MLIPLIETGVISWTGLRGLSNNSYDLREKVLQSLQLSITDQNLAAALCAQRLNFNVVFNQAEVTILSQLKDNGYFKVGELKSLSISDNQYHSLQNFSTNPIVQLISNIALSVGGEIQDNSLLQFVLDKNLSNQEVSMVGFMYAVVHLVAKNAFIELAQKHNINLNDKLKTKFEHALATADSNLNAVFSVLTKQKPKQSWHIDNAVINLSTVNGDGQGTLIMPKNQVSSFLEFLKIYTLNSQLPAFYADILPQVTLIADKLASKLTIIERNKLNNQLFEILTTKSFPINFPPNQINRPSLSVQALLPNTTNLYFGRGIIKYVNYVLGATLSSSLGAVNTTDLQFGHALQPLIHSSPTVNIQNKARTVSNINLNYI